MPDFYMEIEWQVESWIPLVGRLAPSDVFKIWKKGGQLRFDNNVRGMDGMKVQRGLTSYLFSLRSIWVVDHTRAAYTDALQKFRHPDYDDIQFEVEQMMEHGRQRNDLCSNNVKFAPKTTMLGYPKQEQIGDYKCDVVSMTGLTFQVVTLKVCRRFLSLSLSPVSFSLLVVSFCPLFYLYSLFGLKKQTSKNQEKKKKNGFGGLLAEVDHDKYFQRRPWISEGKVGEEGHQEQKQQHEQVEQGKEDEDDVDVERKNVVVSEKHVAASLWLSQDFPLPIATFLKLLDIVAPASHDLSKLRDILKIELPPGFPVKLHMPILPALNASVVFSKYVPNHADLDDAAIFQLPADFSHE